MGRPRDPPLGRPRQDRGVASRTRQSNLMSETEERTPSTTDSADSADVRSDGDWRMPDGYEPPPPPAPPFSWPVPPPGTDITSPQHEFHHPLDRVTGRLPR